MHTFFLEFVIDNWSESSPRTEYFPQVYTDWASDKRYADLNPFSQA